MSTPEQRLSELGIELPVPAAAAGNYQPIVQTGNLLFCAGTLSVLNGEITHSGPVGRDQSIEAGYESAKIAALNSLANLKAYLGDLSRVKRVVMVNGFVNGIAGFADSPAVINGASDVLVAAFGEAGKHARAAVTVAGLPKNSTTEVQLIVEIK